MYEALDPDLSQPDVYKAEYKQSLAVDVSNFRSR